MHLSVMEHLISVLLRFILSWFQSSFLSVYILQLIKSYKLLSLGYCSLWWYNFCFNIQFRSFHRKKRVTGWLLPSFVPCMSVHYMIMLSQILCPVVIARIICFDALKNNLQDFDNLSLSIFFHRHFVLSTWLSGSNKQFLYLHL